MTRLLPVRKMVGVAALATMLVAPLAPAASAAAPRNGGHPQLQLVKDTWRSFTAMVDAGDRPAGRQHRGRPRPGDPLEVHLADQHRRLPVVGDRGGGPRRDLRARAGVPHQEDPRLGREAGSGTRRPASSTTGTTRRRSRSCCVWPEDGSVVYPFLSSVDNAWMAAALMVVRNAVPRGPRAGAAPARPDGLRVLLRPGRPLAGCGSRPHARRVLGRRRRPVARCRATTPATARTSGTPATPTGTSPARPG